MKVIREPNEKLGKLWGVGKANPEAEYRLMKYHLKTECDDGTLLYSVVTGQMVLLDEDEKKMLDTLPGKYSEIMTPLIEARFIVPTDFNEKKSCDQLRALMRKLDYRKDITGYTILPTTCCNARCFYCYEADYPHRTMSDETAEKLLDFMDAHCGENRKVSIGWFGGEPTLCSDRISSICEELTKRGIEYSASMISNGYLFTKEMAKTAKELWHLNMIQITLDGTEEIYNKTKAYVGVKDNPYYRVLDNIGYILDNEISVSVRMNLDRHNCDNLHELIDELAERFSGRKGFSAYVHTLFDDCGYTKVHHSDNENDELYKLQIKLENHIREKEIAHNNDSSELPILKPNFCMADNKCSLMVNPNGDFGKCEHYIYDRLVGGLDKEINHEAVRLWEEYFQWNDCFDCPLYPNCYRLKQCGTCKPCVKPEKESKIKRLTKNVHKYYVTYLNKQKNNISKEYSEV